MTVTVGFAGIIAAACRSHCLLTPHPAMSVPAPCRVQVLPENSVSVSTVVKFTGTPSRAVPVFVPSGSVAVIARVATGSRKTTPVPPPGVGFCACTDKLLLEPAVAGTCATRAVADW